MEGLSKCAIKYLPRFLKVDNIQISLYLRFVDKYRLLIMQICGGILIRQYDYLQKERIGTSSFKLY